MHRCRISCFNREKFKVHFRSLPDVSLKLCLWVLWTSSQGIRLRNHVLRNHEKEFDFEFAYRAFRTMNFSVELWHVFNPPRSKHKLQTSTRVVPNGGFIIKIKCCFQLQVRVGTTRTFHFATLMMTTVIISTPRNTDSSDEWIDALLFFRPDLMRIETIIRVKTRIAGNCASSKECSDHKKISSWYCFLSACCNEKIRTKNRAQAYFILIRKRSIGNSFWRKLTRKTKKWKKRKIPSF